MNPDFAPPRRLRAGPVELVLADGELRYLYVGQREIVRRLYFCVRFHDKWDTAPNEVTRCDVREDGSSFSVAIAARAVVGPVNYGWTAEITGTKDGTVRFAVQGSALTENTQIRRTGLQLLLGGAAVAGQPFVMTRPDGSELRQTLPVRLDPDVLPMQFHRLAYTTRENAVVSAEFTGSLFGFEDQRNFNDSSFKFFSAHAHTYPTLAPGACAESCVTLRIRNLPSQLAVPPPLSASVGGLITDARIPVVTVAAESTPTRVFYSLNKNRAALEGNASHTWGFTPAVNLYDDETFMEDTAAVLDQARTARVFPGPSGAGTRCRLDPVHFESLHPRPQRDPRNFTSFAAAWLVSFVKYAALGEVESVAVRLGPGPVDAVRAALLIRAGRPVRAVAVRAPGHPPLEAFGILFPDQETEIWLANVTGKPFTLPLEGVPQGRYELRRTHLTQSGELMPDIQVTVGNRMLIALAPYEVCVLSPAIFP